MSHPTVNVEPVFAVITTSDSRFKKAIEGGSYSDESGSTAKRLLEGKGFKVLGPILAPNDVKVLEGLMGYLTSEGLANVVLVIGGTGVSRRDVSVEAVEEVSDRILPGFGEAFRALTRELSLERSLFTRAIAGVHGGSLLFAIPGSPDAVRLAVEELIISSVRHLLGETRR